MLRAVTLEAPPFSLGRYEPTGKRHFGRLERMTAARPNQPYSSQVAFRQQILKVTEFNVDRT
jgi:hypothetical protein